MFIQQRGEMKMSYEDETYETYYFSHRCPRCGKLTADVSVGWLVNGSEEERDEWEAQGPHITFICDRCEHKWPMIFEAGSWEMDLDVTNGRYRYILYNSSWLRYDHEPFPVAEFVSNHEMPPSEVFLKLISGGREYLPENEGWMIRVAKPHGNSASVMVPKMMTGREFLLIPVGGE